MAINNWMDKTIYRQYQDYWDDILFREYILNQLRPDMDVLDLGAGAGIVAEMNFRGLARRVCGVDPEPRVADNPYLDEAKIGTGEAIPWQDGSFDMVFADNVLEHLSDPVGVFEEVCRVLRPGGVFLFKTPNKWHYMPIIARLTPTSFHRYYNRVRGRAYQDTFPTLYRANSPRDIDALARRAGLRATEFRLIEGRPEYLRLNALTYAVGALYERVVNATDALSILRILLMGKLEK